MNSTTKRGALAVLQELCELSPDVRLGQLMAHLGFLGEDQTGRTLWEIDDEQLLAILYYHRGELNGRTIVAPRQALDVTGGTPVAESSSTSRTGSG